ncbi:hypothetical protein LINGRAHAP2_LOCUS13919 [Linum grandiflorum]
MEHVSFPTWLQESWTARNVREDKLFSLAMKLKFLKAELKVWNKEVFKRLEGQVSECLSEIVRFGGLGIQDLKILNTALICKWGRRFVVERDAWWRRLIVLKCGKGPSVWLPVACVYTLAIFSQGRGFGGMAPASPLHIVTTSCYHHGGTDDGWMAFVQQWGVFSSVVEKASSRAAVSWHSKLPT